MRRNTYERIGKVYYLSSSGIMLSYHVLKLENKGFRKCLQTSRDCRMQESKNGSQKRKLNKFFPLR